MMNIQNSPNPSIFTLDDDLAMHALYDRLALKQGLQHTNFDTIGQVLDYLVLSEDWPSVFILDRLLPDGDGLDFAVHLRDNFPVLSDTHFILISGAKTDNQDPRLASARIDYTLEKPFPLNELSHHISEVLSRTKVDMPTIEDSFINVAFADDLLRLSIELLHASQSPNANPNRILHSIFGIAGMLEQEMLRTTTARLMNMVDGITEVEHLPMILHVVHQCETIAQQMTEESDNAAMVAV